MWEMAAGQDALRAANQFSTDSDWRKVTNSSQNEIETSSGYYWNRKTGGYSMNAIGMHSLQVHDMAVEHTAEVSERFPWTPLCRPFTPESQWQPRGKRRSSQGVNGKRWAYSCRSWRCSSGAWLWPGGRTRCCGRRGSEEETQGQ